MDNSPYRDLEASAANPSAPEKKAQPYPRVISRALILHALTHAELWNMNSAQSPSVLSKGEEREHVVYMDFMDCINFQTKPI